MAISASFRSLNKKYDRLLELVAAKPGWVAFSGGVDSTLLLRAALEARPELATAVFADSALQAQVDRDNIRLVAASLGASLRLVTVHPLLSREFVANSAERCYLCKKSVYHEFLKSVPAGLSLMDGTNSDDQIETRPGHQALVELGVETPLREAGLGKEEIRALAFRLSLPNWDRPSASCLATRIPTGIPISTDLLIRIEECEILVRQFGFGHIRVRPVYGDLRQVQVELASEEIADERFTSTKQQIRTALEKIGVVRLEFSGRDGVYVDRTSSCAEFGAGASQL